MDIDNGLFVVRVDGLEGPAFNAGDEFIVDKSVAVRKDIRANVDGRKLTVQLAARRSGGQS